MRLVSIVAMLLTVVGCETTTISAVSKDDFAKLSENTADIAEQVQNANNNIIKLADNQTQLADSIDTLLTDKTPQEKETEIKPKIEQVKKTAAEIKMSATTSNEKLQKTKHDIEYQATVVKAQKEFSKTKWTSTGTVILMLIVAVVFVGIGVLLRLKL